VEVAGFWRARFETHCRVAPRIRLDLGPVNISNSLGEAMTKGRFANTAWSDDHDKGRFHRMIEYTSKLGVNAREQRVRDDEPVEVRQPLGYRLREKTRWDRFRPHLYSL